MLTEIEKINSVSIQEVLQSSELTGLVLRVYANLFDCKNPKFCTRSITEYFEKIKTEGKQYLKLKTMERKYNLKRDVLVWDATTAKHYNYMTITDEIAERMVKLNPRMANQFENIIKPEVLQPEQNKIKAEVITVPKAPKERKVRTPKTK